MYSCKEFADMTESYIDNELTTEEKQEFELHMKKCSACMEEYRFALALRNALKENMPEPPADFLSRVNMAIDKERDVVSAPKKNVLKRFLNYRAVQTVAACLIVAVFLGLNNELGDKISDVENDTLVPVKTQIMGASEFISIETAEPEKTEILQTEEKKSTVRKKAVKEDTTEPSAAVSEPEQKESADITVTPEPFEAIDTDTAATPVQQSEISVASEEYPQLAAYSAEAVSEQADEAVDGEADVKSMSRMLTGETEFTAEENSDQASSAEENSTTTSEPHMKKASGGGSPAGGAVSAGGGGGGSSAVITKDTALPEKKSADGKLSVTAERIAEAKNVAMHYGSCENGVFGMTADKYNSFVAELESLGIEYSATFEISEAVRFEIVEK